MNKYINIAMRLARKSNLAQKHCAIIVRGSSILMVSVEWALV